ncbi:MAG: CHAP domain-containing protein [Candidatus Dormibacteria bacterium]
MRGARLAGRVWLAASVAGALWISTIFGTASGTSAKQSNDPINQQALTSLLDQLEAQGQVANVAAVKDLLAKIQSNQDYLASLNQQLSTDQTNLAVLDVQLTGDRNALVNLVSTAYVDGNGAQEVAQALASPNMTQFFDSSTLPEAIASQVSQLVGSIDHDRHAMSGAEDQLLADESQALSVQGQLGAQSRQLLADLTRPTPAVTTGDWSFAFGTCTYWASGQWRANGWPVNWGGDAWQWWANAGAAGHPEGETPAVGAIVVWPPDVSGESWGAGHVAYVIAVGAGEFEVSEMNFYGPTGGGFDQVDYRWVPDSGAGFDGFIYPPGGAS